MRLTTHLPYLGAFVLGAIVLGGAFSLSMPAPATPSPPQQDTTQTKPLRLLMAGLAQDMARINTGIWYEDYDLMEQGGTAIANHPKIPPAQIAKIKKALGTEFKAFVQYDQTVHNTAVELAEAASDRNLTAVLDAYTRIRNGCTGCHTAYRDRLRPVLAP